MKLIPGVLHVSSIVILGFNKRKIPKKKFSPFDKSLPKYSVSTKIPLQDVDVYCVVREEDKDKEDKEDKEVKEVKDVKEIKEVKEENRENRYKAANLEYIIGNVGDYRAENT